jgi:hypothetical protein
MKASKTSLFSSRRAAASVLGYAQFVAMGVMAGNINRLPAAEKMAHRSKPAMLLCEKMNYARACYWSITQVLGDTYDMVHDLESAVDKAVITRVTTIKPEEMKQLAEATGLSVAEVTAKRQEQYAKAYAGEEERAAALKLFIEEGEFSDPIDLDDVEIDAEKAHAKIVEVATWIAGWSKPDYAELMLIKHDRIMVEGWALNELALGDGAPDTYEEQPADHLTKAETHAAILRAADRYSTPTSRASSR